MGFVIRKSLKIGQIETLIHKHHLAIFLQLGYFLTLFNQLLLALLARYENETFLSDLTYIQM